MSRPQYGTRTPAATQPPATQQSATRRPATQRFSRKAIWSLVLSVLWLGGIGAIAGILLGVSARHQIARTGERGNGVAVAGIAVGVITLLFAVAYWIFVATHLGGASTGGGGGYGY